MGSALTPQRHHRDTETPAAPRPGPATAAAPDTRDLGPATETATSTLVPTLALPVALVLVLALNLVLTLALVLVLALALIITFDLTLNHYRHHLQHPRP